MRTKIEQAESEADELRAIAAAILELRERAKRIERTTLAYLADMAMFEAEAGARRDKTRLVVEEQTG